MQIKAKDKGCLCIAPNLLVLRSPAKRDEAWIHLILRLNLYPAQTYPSRPRYEVCEISGLDSGLSVGYIQLFAKYADCCDVL